MAKEIEKYFVRRLHTVLTEYLKDFSQNNVAQFSLGISNNISLENLAIRREVLMKFHVPMYIVDGKIGRINIKMPINYKKNPSHILIENIELTVTAISETNIIGFQKDVKLKNESPDLEDHQEMYKKSKLRLWQESMTKYFEALSPPNWIQQLVDNIYDNMSITFKKVSLNFQNTSLFGYDTIMKIKFDELTIQTTDSKWNIQFNADRNVSYKLITLTKFSVTLSASQNGSKNPKDNYIIHPMDIQIKMTKQKANQDPSIPLLTLDIRILQPLILMFNKDQKNYLIKLNKLLSNLEIIQDNFHLRPQVPVKKNSVLWWKYSIQATAEKQKQLKLNLNFSVQRIVLMKRYINLYKRKQNIIHVPWLTQWTVQDEYIYQHCEKVLPLKDLIKYRQWAFTEIRLEAKRYFNSSKDGSDGKGVKPLLEIWTNTINNENAFNDQKKGEKDDVPIELQSSEKINLYEVLEIDQGKVLDSYLKGQSNSPEQKELDLELTINSIFILLLEEKQDSLILFSPENLRIYQNCQCSKCPSGQPQKTKMNQKTNTYIQQRDNIIRQNKNLKTQPPMPVKQQNIFRYDMNNNTNSKQLPQDLQNLLETDKINDSFVTAKGNDNDKDSFLSDLNDLQNDLPEQFVEQEQNYQDSNQNQKNKIGQNVNQIPTQRLFLIIEMKLIRLSMIKFRDNKIMTKQGVNGGSVISDLKVMAPGCLTKFIPEVPDKFKERDKAKQSHDPIKLLMKKKWVEFLTEIYDIVITKDPVFLNSDQNFQYLKDFLNNNNMSNMADFLENYENDKNYFQDFIAKNFKPYDQFFDVNSKNYLHIVDKKEVGKKDQYQEYNYSSQLENLHSKVVNIIKNYVFPVFLEEYGIWILPNSIEYLKQKQEYNIDSMSSSKLKETADIRMDFTIQGKTQEFQIIPSQKNMKKPTSNPVQKSDQSVSEPDKQPLKPSSVAIRFGQQKIYLTARSLKSLIQFLNSDSGSIESTQSDLITENAKLLDCMMKSQTLNDTINLSNKSLNLCIDMPQTIKIIVLSDALHNKIRSETKVQIWNFKLRTMFQNDLARKFEKIPNLQPLVNRHKYYQFYFIDLKDITISHKFIKKDLTHDITLQQSHKKILNFGLSIIFVNSLIPNHAVLTDNKIYVQIPTFKLEISDNIPGFLEVLQVCQNNQQSKINKPTTFIKQYPKRQIDPYGYNSQKESILSAELGSLFQDHISNSSNCRHCIIKYRKTCKLINLVFGNLSKILDKSKQADATWFDVLQYQSNYGRGENTMNGIDLEFNALSRVAGLSNNSTVLIIPILIITQDQGFFKNNITVISTQSYYENDGIKHNDYLMQQQQNNRVDSQQNGNLISSQSIPDNQRKQRHSLLYKLTSLEKNFLSVLPLYQIKEEFIGKLDERHVFYCKQLEASLFKNNFHSSEEQDDNKQHFNNSTQLYMLAFIHQPLRLELLKKCENNLTNKSLKTQVYFRVKKIFLRFGHPLAACTIPTVIQNLSYAQKFIENAWKIIYDQGQTFEVKTSVTSGDFNAEQNPLYKLDQMIILLSIDSLQLQTQVQGENNKIIFLMKDLNIQYNLDLLQKEQKSISQIKKPFLNLDLTNTQSGKSQMNSIREEQEIQVIMTCLDISLNFSQVTHFLVQKLSLQREGSKIILSVTRVSLKNSTNTILMIPSTSSKKNFNDKQQQYQENSLQNPPIYALTVRLEYVAGLTDVKFKLAPTKIYLSKENIQEFIMSVNILVLILIQESREYQSNLINKIFSHEYLTLSAQKFDLFKFVKSNRVNENQNAQAFRALLELEQVSIMFKKDLKTFCKLSLQKLVIQQKLNKEIEADVEEIGFYPNPEDEEITEKTQDFIQKTPLNLIGRSSENLPLQLKLVMGLQNKIYIQLDNIMFKMISVYLNELEAFMSEIQVEMANSMTQFLDEGGKKSKKIHKIEEVEKLMKNQSKIQITLINSSIMIPQSSKSQNNLRIYFSKAEIFIKNKMLKISVPLIGQPQKKKNLIVDYQQEMQVHEIHTKQIKATLKDVEAIYELNTVQGQLFGAEQIKAKIYVPLLDPLLYLHWQYKSTLHLDIKDLEMKMDLGKMMVIQDLVDENLGEPSEFFKFKPKSFDKINMKLDVKSMQMKVEKFILQEKNEVFEQDSGEEGSDPSSDNE